MFSLTRLMNAPIGVQRLLAILAPAGALLVAAWLGALIVRDHANSIADIVAKRERLGQLQAIAQMEPALRNANNDTQENADDVLFLRGPSEAVILADLQGRINTLAQTSAANVQSVGNLPASERDGVRYVGLSVDVNGKSEDVLSLIYALETSTPYLIIRNANIRAQEVVDASGKRLPTNMFVKLDVFGALVPDEVTGGT